MGCVSSKILVSRSLSFQEEVNKRLIERRAKAVELLNSQDANAGDHLLTLPCAPNPASTKAKPPSPPSDHDEGSNASPAPEPEPVKFEIINAWELLADLDEEKEVTDDQKVEEYNFISTGGSTSGAVEHGSGAKRKAMAKELAALKVPPAFEFTKTGSLREWLQRGGQVVSPGSYITPKFGSFVFPGASGREEDDAVVFDPEMVSQFEQAMTQLAADEELLLQRIAESSELETDAIAA